MPIMAIGAAIGGLGAAALVEGAAASTILGVAGLGAMVGSAVDQQNAVKKAQASADKKMSKAERKLREQKDAQEAVTKQRRQFSMLEQQRMNLVAVLLKRKRN